MPIVKSTVGSGTVSCTYTMLHLELLQTKFNLWLLQSLFISAITSHWHGHMNCRLQRDSSRQKASTLTTRPPQPRPGAVNVLLELIWQFSILKGKGINLITVGKLLEIICKLEACNTLQGAWVQGTKVLKLVIDAHLLSKVSSRYD